MKPKPKQSSKPPFKQSSKPRRRGFERASGLLQDQIRSVGAARGFAVSRLLTHWAEIVGEETAATALPVKISYGHGGLGATLTVLTTGAMAPMLQADLPRIREKVNACYGYAAISRIRITQSAPTGFAEGKIAFSPAPTAKAAPPDPRIARAAHESARGIDDHELRDAVEALGRNVLSRGVRR
ncbi:MAG: DUF721 domain-containing protein [Paracoccaceae bacterium]